jgi:hypothetical protein
MLAAISAFVLAVVLIIWMRGADWIGRQSDFIRTVGVYDGGALSDVGQTWLGIYSHDGRVGIVRIENGVSSLDRDELAAMHPGAPFSSWFWDRSGTTDSYFGNLPDALADATVTWQIPHCLSICDGEDAGMRHFQRVRAVLMEDWLLAGVAAIPLVVFLGTAVRLGRRKRHGTCLRCGYDLRASPGRCPECGNLPDAPSL